MAFWNKKKKEPKSCPKTERCNDLEDELEEHRVQYEELDQNIRKIQSKRNGRKYTKKSKDLDDTEALTA